MIRDYLQDALQTFNGGNWYGWRKLDDDGNKIPNNQRMTYENVIVIKDADTAVETNKTSGKAKLKSGDALTDAEISALFGDN